jgi:hypothetical protein
MDMIKVNLYYLEEGELCESSINSLFIKRNFQEHIVQCAYCAYSLKQIFANKL